MCLSSSGPLYHNNKCVWCLQGEVPKHPDMACGRLHEMTTDTAWKNFKNHISRIDDSQLSDRLSRLVHSISNLQASKIKYHLSCWKKYVTSHDLSLHPQNSLVKCRVMLPENIAKIIIPLHIISGSDHTSAFFGHGQKKLLKKGMHYPQSADLLQRVGQDLPLQDGVKTEMRKVVIRKFYEESYHDTCGNARASKWNRLRKNNSQATTRSRFS